MLGIRVGCRLSVSVGVGLGMPDGRPLCTALRARDGWLLSFTVGAVLGVPVLGLADTCILGSIEGVGVGRVEGDALVEGGFDRIPNGKPLGDRLGASVASAPVKVFGAADGFRTG
jgi:hypothetical protein